jgi:hypothetical protein
MIIIFHLLHSFITNKTLTMADTSECIPTRLESLPKLERWLLVCQMEHQQARRQTDRAIATVEHTLAQSKKDLDDTLLRAGNDDKAREAAIVEYEDHEASVRHFLSLFYTFLSATQADIDDAQRNLDNYLAIQKLRPTADRIARSADIVKAPVCVNTSRLLNREPYGMNVKC